MEAKVSREVACRIELEGAIQSMIAQYPWCVDHQFQFNFAIDGNLNLSGKGTLDDIRKHMDGNTFETGVIQLVPIVAHIKVD